MPTEETTICPMHSVMQVLGGKWKFAILYCLRDGTPKRFTVLQREIVGITARMLIKELKSLDQHQLISRKAYPTVPPTVEYKLTAYGKTLVPMIGDLDGWGRKHATRLNKN
ncbi:MAG: helix-turn-helix domain-containing protein [Abditibacteriaceae bacterium]